MSITFHTDILREKCKDVKASLYDALQNITHSQNSKMHILVDMSASMHIWSKAFTSGTTSNWISNAMYKKEKSRWDTFPSQLLFSSPLWVHRMYFQFPLHPNSNCTKLKTYKNCAGTLWWSHHVTFTWMSITFHTDILREKCQDVKASLYDALQNITDSQNLKMHILVDMSVSMHIWS